MEFYSKNKFEKLLHLVGFIIRLYHDARSPERQIPQALLPKSETTATLYLNNQTGVSSHMSSLGMCSNIKLYNHAQTEHHHHKKCTFIQYLSSLFMENETCQVKNV